MRNAINVGDRVAFSRAFLRNTGQFTGWKPFARGKVTKIADIRAWDDGNGLATVEWVMGDAPYPYSQVLLSNLVRADRIHLEPV
jgi:hypothetical protein